MPARDSIQSVIIALDGELTERKIPTDAYAIQPIVFSGNFSGRHGLKNKSQCGFRVTCTDMAYSRVIGDVFARLAFSPKVRQGSRETRSCIASSPVQPSQIMEFTAGSAADLIEALNACVLSNARRINQTQCNPPSLG